MATGVVRSVAIRLEMQGDNVVVRKLEEVGKGGEAALARIKNSAREVPGHLKAIDSVSSDLQNELRSLGGRAGMAGNALMAMGPVGVGIAATLGAIALAAHTAFSKTSEAMELADTLESTAKRIGVGKEALQEWTAAAKDVDIADADVISGLTTIKDKVDQYVAGLMRAQEAEPFKRLGLTREALAGAKDASEQLLMIAEALKRIPEAERGGLLTKLGIPALLPLLGQGRAELDRMFAAARAQGQVLSDSVTNPLAEANKEADKLTRKIENDWARAFKGLAPTMNWFKSIWADIVGRIADAVAKMDQPARARLTDRADALTKDIDVQSALLDQVRKRTGLGIGGVFLGAGPGTDWGGNLVGLNEAGFGVGLTEKAILQRIAADREELAKVAGQLAKLGGAESPQGAGASAGAKPPKLSKSLADQAAAEAAAARDKRLEEQRRAYLAHLAQEEAAADTDRITAEDRANVARLKGKAGYYEAVARMIRDSADAEVSEIEAAAKTELEQLDKLEQAFHDAGKTVPADIAAQRKTIEDIKNTRIATVRAKQTTEAEQNAKEARGELGRMVDDIKPLDEAFNDVAASGLKGFEDALVGIATRSREAGEAFRQMALSIIADIARIAIQQSITKPLGNWLGGALGSLFGTGHAGGGPVKAGVLYPVNERGVEVLQTSNDAYVLSHQQSVGAIAAAVAKQARPQVVVAASAPKVEVHNHGEPLAVESRRYDPATNTLRLDLRRSVAKAVAQSVRDGELDRAMAERYGAQPMLKRRS